MTCVKKFNRSHAVIFTLLTAWFGVMHTRAEAFQERPDSTRLKQDTIPEQYRPSRKPTFRLRDRYGDPFSNTTTASPLFLKDPTKVNLDVALDSNLNYTIYEKIGDLNYRPVTTMSLEEFKALQDRRMLKDYWQNKSRGMDGESPVSGRGIIPKIFISPVLDRIFGGSYVELIPRGFVTLDFGGSFQRIYNPQLPIRQQRNGGFEFDQQINMSVVGKVGEKLAVSANFDNNNSFDFQNNMKVEYTGFKEDILKKLEIGNVSLPLNNTLIQGSQNLFGIKAQMQFGKLFVTSIASTQRGKVESINIPGGSNGQGRQFQFVASEYDESRHFFLGHYFRDNYQRWALNSQQNSGINITRIEVYLINRSNDTQTLRSVVGFADMGEPRVIYNKNVVSSNGASRPNDNESNTLFNDLNTAGISRQGDAVVRDLENFGLVNGTDFEKINSARRLSPTEYTLHKQLGYITLSRKLQSDEALAVAYEYTNESGTWQVGELSEDYAARPESEVIYLKLLRSREYYPTDANNRTLPMWDLMMKNIYNLNVSQLSPEGFQLRVIYRDDRTGIDNPQLQEGVIARNKQLIEIMGLDRLNPVGDPPGDGNFDFVEGLTVNSQTGLIIFPYLEPFNTPLRAAFADEPLRSYLVNKYVFDTLYRIPRAQAQLLANKNKFFLVGTYNSSGSSKEIMIPGFGVTPGSVRVYAGGTPLLEQSDYVVDYTFGRVTILNDAILNSGKDVTVDYEQSDPFAFQTRTLLGARFDYKLSEDVNFGSTVLYYNERPLISRNAIGTEPARNLQYGFDVNIRKDSRLLTKWIDAIPGIQTKELSSFTWNAEFAQLLPGTSNILDENGTGYIDDFENTATPYSLLNPAAWKLAAAPKDLYASPDGSGLEAGYRRAKLAWYQVDNQFYRDGGQFKPKNITDQDLQNHYVRAVGPQEIFPYRNLTQNNFFEQVFDIAYFPNERGPYNYDPFRLNPNGLFSTSAARDNWAGITTAIRTEVDFTKANIEYVEFWMMDPFIQTPNGRIIDGVFNTNNTTGGKLLFHLGTISEDVIPDSKHGFENGLPVDGNLESNPLVVPTPWGYVTNQSYLNNAFDNSSSSRKNQDVGLDGLSNNSGSMNEQRFFESYLTTLQSSLNNEAYELIRKDPSGDDFQYFLGKELDENNAKILERYKNYNGMENNTPIISGTDQIARSGSPYPDNEDLNQDATITELSSEEYYEYAIDLKAGNLRVGSEYIVDEIEATIQGQAEKVKWYLFRIPIQQEKGRTKVGNISGFTSIRYARMILTEFQQPVVLRLANFRMVGAQWRKYAESLREGGITTDPEPGDENISISVVNIEENSRPTELKSPYVVPPGVIRDRDNTSSIARQLNEQSIQVCIEDLKDGDARAIYKNVSMDFFNYGRIKMFTHANSVLTEDDELVVFMRLGTDFDQNYYEVEIPLKISKNTYDADERAVWPEANEFDFALAQLYKIKVERDNNNFPLNIPYPLNGPSVEGRHGFRVLGRPDLTQVRVIMIGVRNPKSPDRKSHSVCLWANELRMTDFDRTAGWAMNTVLNAKLADFAVVSGSFRYTGFGFGSVNSKISERSRDQTTNYDITANINLDKLFLSNTGIKLPMMLSYGNTTINPQFDPANPDVRLDGFLNTLPDRERNEYKRLIQDRTVMRGINFTNVRKVKNNPQAESHLYDIENLSFNLSYRDKVNRSFTMHAYEEREYKAGAAYNFSSKGGVIEPFKKTDGLKSPYFRLIKDLKIGLLPNNILVRGDLNRYFEKRVYRNAESISDPNYRKYFLFDRRYGLKWDLTENLSLEYTSLANTVIDEPEGEGEEVKRALQQNLKNFGRMKNFNQTVTANWVAPLDKIPVTDWLGFEYRYQVTYNWRAGPLYDPTLEGSLDFKNTIQNSRDQTLTGRLEMVKLYNKVKFLKDINSPPRISTVKTKQPDTVRTTPPVVKGLFRLLMSLRSINGTYSVTEGTILPGFAPSPWLFGVDRYGAPGWKFVLGDQDGDIRFRAASKGWLSMEEQLTNYFTQSRTKSLSLRAQIDPANDLKIQLDYKKDVTDTYQEIFRFSPADPDYISGFASLSPSRVGTYKISTISILTAFDKTNDELSSNVFRQFEKNLDIIRNRFNLENPDTTTYNRTSQDVTIASFLAAYTGKDANTVSLSPFPKTPLPNWQITYNGLINIPVFKEAFQAITITHGYGSSYQVLNYANSQEYQDPTRIGLSVPIEDYNNGTFGTGQRPIYVISQVLISEQFQPLIGINIRTKKRLSVRADYKTKRELSLFVSNAQITELSSKDVSVEVGYTKNNFRLPIKTQGRTIVLKNDVTFRLNVTVADSKTIQRSIELPNRITSGNINFQLRPNVSYIVNQKLSMMLYYEYTLNDPVVSNAFRRNTTRFGAQIRFSLAQ